eukprot:TRINITY_DN48194_c0_g1_i1.p3 TRINITY_DN48194_c0_g1~~TRINITY_DN48194_c0_g1_i1.p3  ORF type:complete len:116 (-),score=0.25 TRINITY_DN48194_c0_g1_i1:303-650(-)
MEISIPEYALKTVVGRLLCGFGCCNNECRRGLFFCVENLCLVEVCLGTLLCWLQEMTKPRSFKIIIAVSYGIQYKIFQQNICLLNISGSFTFQMQPMIPVYFLCMYMFQQLLAKF